MQVFISEEHCFNDHICMRTKCRNAIFNFSQSTELMIYPFQTFDPFLKFSRNKKKNLILVSSFGIFPAGIYCSKLIVIKNRTTCEICSGLTLRKQSNKWHLSGAFVVNFEHISHHVLVFLLLTWNMLLPAGVAIKLLQHKIWHLESYTFFQIST